MKFDISQYQGKYAMHCKTEEEAEIFLEHLTKLGRCWCDGESYLKRTQYYKNKEQTAYNFNGGKLASAHWYLHNGYILLRFEDFEWDDDISPSSRDIQRLDNFFSQFAISKL